MKTIFDNATRQELINRINTLTENSQPQWGKMNIFQILKHRTLAQEIYLGNKQYNHILPGRLLGKPALKKLLKEDEPMGCHAPTPNMSKIKETNGNVDAEKTKWTTLLAAYESNS